MLPTRRAIWYSVNTYVTLHFSRLQNSPYFCLFKYAPAVKQKVWNDAENRERDWGETARRVRLLRHTLPISLLILRKKPTVCSLNKYLKTTIQDKRQAPIRIVARAMTRKRN